jgi:diguanylate cyclase (GGDEF)-like protein
MTLVVAVLVLNALAVLIIGDAAWWLLAIAGFCGAAMLEAARIRIGQIPHRSMMISLPVLVLPAIAPVVPAFAAVGIIALGVLVVVNVHPGRTIVAIYSAAIAGVGSLLVLVFAWMLFTAGVPVNTALAVGCGIYVVFVIIAESIRVRFVSREITPARRLPFSVLRAATVMLITIAIAVMAGRWSEFGLPLMSAGTGELNTLIVLLLLVVVITGVNVSILSISMRRRLVGLISGTRALSTSETFTTVTADVRGARAVSDEKAAEGIGEVLCQAIYNTIGAESVVVHAEAPRSGEIGSLVSLHRDRTEYVVARRDGRDRAFTADDRSALKALADAANAVMTSRFNIGGLTARANSDPLTGLPNYGAFHDALTNINDHREYSEALAVLFIDLDDFKTLNDKHGHSVGDEMLRAVGHRLEAAVRPQDFVARVGGDEFVIILTHLSSVHEAKSTAERIMEATSGLVSIGVHTFTPVLSIGLAYSAHRETDIDGLVNDADRSMLITKKARREVGSAKKSSIYVSSHRSSHLNDVVVRAIDDDRLELAFQPIVSLINGQIWAFEALVRYFDEEVGAVPPSSLIEKAKSLGRMDSLTRQVATKAMAAASAFRLVEPRIVCMTINVEASQLLPERVGTFFVDLAEQYPGISLCLELNERSVARVSNDIRSEAERLRDLGIMIALDDYGSQDSSVDALVRMPMDILKIDRSLVDDLDDIRQREVLTALQGFGDNLEYSMIVEGVENQAMADHLNAIGVRSAQGYHYGVPESLDHTLARLESFGAAAIVPREVGVPTGAN